MKKFPKRCEKILHLAGQSSGEISFENPSLDLKKNTTSTLNLIHYGINKKVKLKELVIILFYIPYILVLEIYIKKVKIYLVILFSIVCKANNFLFNFTSKFL